MLARTFGCVRSVWNDAAAARKAVSARPAVSVDCCQVKALVSENQALYVEDLNVKGLARGYSSKSVHDAAFGMFLSRLESKAARAGRAFVKIDRFFPSTRLCSACGALTGPTGLAGLRVRLWECGCGARHDRDVNAEINIRREGQRLVAAGQSDT